MRYFYTSDATKKVLMTIIKFSIIRERRGLLCFFD